MRYLLLLPLYLKTSFVSYIIFNLILYNLLNSVNFVYAINASSYLSCQQNQNVCWKGFTINYNLIKIYLATNSHPLTQNQNKIFKLKFLLKGGIFGIRHRILKSCYENKLFFLCLNGFWNVRIVFCGCWCDN